MHLRKHMQRLFSLGLLVAPWGAAQERTAGGGKPNYDIREEGPKPATAAVFERGSGASQAALSERLQTAMSQAEADLRSDLPSLTVDYGKLLASPVVVGTQTGERFLTAPSSQPREAIFREFLGRNADLFGLSAAQLGEFVTTQDYTNPAGNLAFVSLQQRVNGLDVFRCELSAAFTAKNELARIRGEVAAGADENAAATIARIDARQAVVAAAASLDVALSATDLRERGRSADGRKVVFEGGAFKQEIEAQQLYFPLKPGLLTLAWSFTLHQDQPAYWMIVDAESGVLLWRKNLLNDQTAPATYDVYADDSPAPLSPTTATPGSGIQGTQVARTTVTLIGNEPPNAFNNLGWMTDGFTTTDGNNVEAGTDRDGTDGVDPTGKPVSPTRNFTFTYNPAPGIPPPGDAPAAGSPPLNAFQSGAATNMFYWTNLYHDRLYRVGFTEPARNFQNDNFGRGGAAADRIRAEVQDSSGTNNANFLTQADGNRGRMQMFIFTGPTPDRDGDLDADVFLHEMTHGTSNRLIGNAAGLNNNRGQSMGEGWSDFYGRSILSTADEDINGLYAAGAYATLNFLTLGTDNYYYGIRRFPYALLTTTGGPLNRPHNPLTFADIDPAQINTSDGAFPITPWITNTANEVHNAGEVWCMTLLEVRARIIASLGFAAGNDRMLQIVTDGMKLTPNAPNFIQARDAIIAADQAGFAGADVPNICAGFAVRGMGVGAVDGGVAVTQSFSSGSNLSLGVVTFSDTPGTPGNNPNGNGFADPGENLVLTVPLINPAASACSLGNATGTTATIGANIGTYGTINQGSTASQPINYTVSAGATCGSIISVPVAISSSLGPSSGSFPLLIGQPQISLTQNFDGVVAPALPAGWTTANVGPVLPWVTSATTPDTAPNDAFTNDPATTGESTLVSPSFLVSSAAAQVTFRHSFITEVNFDGGVLEIAIGAGVFQDILAAGGSFVSGGYNSTIGNFAGCSATPNPLATRAGWTGTSAGGYITTVANLPPAANGQNVRLRWRFGSDCSVASTGWRVDTISVVAGFTCASVPVELQSFRIE